MDRFCTPIEYSPCADPSNLETAMLSRLAHPYQGQPNLASFISALLAQYVDIESNLCAFLDNFDCDTAVGDQLDIIGRLVGLPRTVCNVFRAPPFGFINTSGEPCCNDDVLGWCEGEWVKDGLQFTDYTFNDDDEYRTFIKAKIISNAFDGSLDYYNRLLQFLFDDVPFDTEGVSSNTGSYVAHHGYGYTQIQVARALTTDETRILNLYKFVLPYFGSYDISILDGQDTFTFGTSPNGWCSDFSRAL